MAAGDCDPHRLVQRQSVPNCFEDFALPRLRCCALELGAIPIEHGLDEADRIGPAGDQLVGNLSKIVVSHDSLLCASLRVSSP
jgi:hypothetical protein